LGIGTRGGYNPDGKIGNIVARTGYNNRKGLDTKDVERDQRRLLGCLKVIVRGEEKSKRKPSGRKGGGGGVGKHGRLGGGRS